MSTTKRELLRQERIRQAQREKRRRRLVIVSVCLVVLVAAVATILVQMSRTEATSYAGDLAPVSVQEDGSVVMARSGTTKPVLDIYEDFQCPICKEFEHINGAQIKQFAAEGKIKVVYHPIAFVNPQGSLRAAAAARCVPGDSWMAFHDELFARQPDERVALAVGDLKKFADGAGITDSAVLSCMESQKHAAQVQQYTQTAFSSGVQGTPTLLLDGRKLPDDQVLTSSGLRGVLENAAK